VGKGASFTVSIPALPRQAAPDWKRDIAPAASRHELRQDMRGVRLLVVDDEDDSREILGQILGDRGAQVHQASSASEAMLLLRSLRPDLMVSDIAMPGRDGYDLVRELRSSGEPFAAMPAIALTAFAHAEDRQRSAEAGFDVHLAKPVDIEELTSAIHRLLSERSALRI
jgi:CheY-like chemotaxis protein